MMNKVLILIMLIIAAFASGAYAQNTMKLFDATPITPTDTTQAWNPIHPFVFETRDVYLSCPVGGAPLAFLTGPNDGGLIVDNFFTLNNDNICPDEWNCFAGTFAPPSSAFGLPVESAYNPVPNIDISEKIVGSGTYTFTLSDYGQYYGNSDIYLHTSCSFGTYVCHKSNGKSAPKTLAVDKGAMAAHLAHGDTAGPCNGS
jgi:hypothetical protein